MCGTILALAVFAFSVTATATSPGALDNNGYLGVEDGFGTEPSWFGVRLSLGSLPSSMTITWSTRKVSKPCLAYWRATDRSAAAIERERESESKVEIACGTSSKVVDSIDDHFVHIVMLQSLDSGSRYGYSVAEDQFSEFVVPVSPPTSSPLGTRLLLLGDLGVLRSLTIPDLKTEMEGKIRYDAILHAGDLAYDLHDLGGRRAEQFLNLIHPLSSKVPYMVCPGNHEAAHNFSLYRSAFSMPGWETSENLYYSFDVGLVHVVMYNTEVFFWPDYFGQSHMKSMFEWMVSDLKEANARRNVIPWVVVVGHRPMYCQRTAAAGHSNASSCGWEAEASRSGIPSDCPHDNPRACRPHHALGPNQLESWPIEELLYDFNVDIAVFGHVHCYQRHFPVYDYRPFNTTMGETFDQYVNPKAPIHVISGAAGNSEMSLGDEEYPNPSIGSCDVSAPWCAYQSGCVSPERRGHDFSYSRVEAHNATHLQWQQYSSTRGRVIDEWWIIRH
jgi:3',5'-cyclic AMP phosphodiesterase CpdA